MLGLTIVPGNLWPSQGAEYMFHVLRLMKRPEIPLHLGAQAPLVHTSVLVHAVPSSQAVPFALLAKLHVPSPLQLPACWHCVAAAQV